MDYNTSTIIKVVFGVHLTLTSLGIQGYWSPDSYFFYNLFFLLTLLWSIHFKDNVEPMQFAIAVNLIAIFLDIVTLSAFYPSSNRVAERISASMAIMNLLLRPVSTFYMIRNCNNRLGLDSDNITNIFTGNTTSGPSGRNTYEDIGN